MKSDLTAKSAFVEPEQAAGNLGSSAKASRRRSRWPWIVGACVLVIGAGGAGGYAFWLHRHADVSALRAFVISDTRPVSSSVTGSLQEIYVKPGDHVVAGQLLAVVSNPALVAEVQHAQRALAAAQKDSNSTQAAIVPPPIASLPGPGFRPPPNIPITPLPSPGTGSAPAVAAVSPQASELQNGITQQEAALSRQRGQTLQASTTLKSAMTALDNAKQLAQEARSPIEGLQTSVDLAKAQSDKFQSLYNDGIISRIEFQKKQAALETSRTALDDANQQAKSADDEVTKRQADVDAAEKAMADSDLRVSQIEKDLAVKQDQLNTARKVTSSAPPLKPQPTSPLVRRPRFSPPPFNAALGLAPVKVAFSPDKHEAAQTMLGAATSELARATEMLKQCRIVAAEDGVVATINVRKGGPVTSGTPVLVLGKPATSRVIAYFSHSAALRIRYGQKCEVSLIGRPDQRFAGMVARFVSPGSTSAPATLEILLPASRPMLESLASGTPLSVTVRGA